MNIEKKLYLSEKRFRNFFQVIYMNYLKDIYFNIYAAPVFNHLNQFLGMDIFLLDENGEKFLSDKAVKVLDNECINSIKDKLRSENYDRCHCGAAENWELECNCKEVLSSSAIMSMVMDESQKKLEENIYKLYQEIISEK